MKKKSFNKKLALKVSTIANLDTGSMEVVKGGCWFTVPSCSYKLECVPSIELMCYSENLCTRECFETTDCP